VTPLKRISYDLGGGVRFAPRGCALPLSTLSLRESRPWNVVFLITG